MQPSSPLPKPHLLVVDDDDRLRDLLGRFLREQGFIVTLAANAQEARRALGWYVFDLMVLDVMMPGETGLEFLRSARGLPLPTLMLSAMGEAEDRISGLEAGAEDYLPKPFEPRELVLRVRAILRRAEKETQASATAVLFGPWRFDMAANRLSRGAEVVALTSGEAAMLRVLAEQAGKPVSREQLAAVLPGEVSERSIDVQVTRLRKKIEEGERPAYLQTVRGVGYALYAAPQTTQAAP
jgi:two-component system phosphate regulon response regulator OmpR